MYEPFTRCGYVVSKRLHYLVSGFTPVNNRLARNSYLREILFYHSIEDKDDAPGVKVSFAFIWLSTNRFTINHITRIKISGKHVCTFRGSNIDYYYCRSQS